MALARLDVSPWLSASFCWIGMIVACEARYQSEVLAMLQTNGGQGSTVIGSIVEGSGVEYS